MRILGIEFSQMFCPDLKELVARFGRRTATMGDDVLGFFGSALGHQL
jgi:hypothetical protein